ncbi:molybdopterin-guanine dinucleotide biosynthesis protein B [Acetobacter indonesiensis NRIC 0313]|nr:molybdopterin-guanine dinucleotide biosynthesis protein B [Acetobacter indonesiensis NRIC 0313]
MSRVDLVVVEGFHADVPATIEVFRPEVGKDALFHTQTNIIAVATTTPAMIAASLMTLNLDDTSAIAEFALRHAYVFHLD